LQGEDLALLPEKAIFWPRREILLVADLHLGKAATFRALGAPVPEHATYETLASLTRLIEKTRPEKLILLGDLFNPKAATHGASLDAFLAWQKAQSLEMILVAGNHDKKAKVLEGTIQTCDECIAEPFLLRHAPAEADRYVLCGHLHPGFRLSARGRRSATL